MREQMRRTPARARQCVSPPGPNDLISRRRRRLIGGDSGRQYVCACMLGVACILAFYIFLLQTVVTVLIPDFVSFAGQRRGGARQICRRQRDRSRSRCDAVRGQPCVLNTVPTSAKHTRRQQLQLYTHAHAHNTRAHGWIYSPPPAIQKYGYILLFFVSLRPIHKQQTHTHTHETCIEKPSAVLYTTHIRDRIKYIHMFNNNHKQIMPDAHANADKRDDFLASTGIAVWLTRRAIQSAARG